MKRQEVRVVVGKGLGCSESPDSHHYWIDDYTMVNDVKVPVIRCSCCRRLLKIGKHLPKEKYEKENPRWMKKKEK